MKINYVYKFLIISLSILGFFSITLYFTNNVKDEKVIHTNYPYEWINAKDIYIPNKLTFAEEEVPLGRIDVKEQLEREIIVNTFYHSSTILLLKKARRFFSIIEPILKRNNIPEDFKYLAIAESGLDPIVISPANAVGLWQLMRGTAKDYKLEINKEIDERYNIEKSTQAACEYLNESYKRYKNWTLVAASYNTGRRNINKQIKRQKSSNYYNLLFGEETARYVYRILALKTLINNPEEYGFYIKHSYPTIETKKIKINGSIKNWADFAKKYKITYKILKNFNPWLRETSLNNKKHKTYYITIPKNTNDFVSR